MLNGNKKPLFEKNMNSRIKGVIAAIIAGVSYGTNPLWGKILYADGFNPHSVLCFRFGVGAAVLGLLMAAKKMQFRTTPRQMGLLVVLGALFAASSLGLYSRFKYMDSGIACTLLFVYPVIIAVVMRLVFLEQTSILTWIALALAMPGLWLLATMGADTHFGWTGFWLVMISAVTYSSYMIIIQKTSLAELPSHTLTFYSLLFTLLFVALHSLFSPEWRLMPPTRPHHYLLALGIGIVPTVISLVTMAAAIRRIGSTPTAIIGTLEPVTAIIIGVFFFHEAFTFRHALGLLLIVASVTLVVLAPLHRRR